MLMKTLLGFFLLGMCMWIIYAWRQTHALQKIVKHMKPFMSSFISELHESYPQHQAVLKLVQVHKHTQYKLASQPETSILHKGSVISICLHNYHEPGKIHTDFNLLTFVILHELAHIMTSDWEHGREFKYHFAFLLFHAVEWGYYQPVDYRKHHVPYCAMFIKDNPYFDNPRLIQKIQEQYLEISPLK
jgi:hypothetical protein